ncbi:L-ribulose-5-phosphate 4-epimerase AraD [Planctomycetota bacterium]|nr:L-ribulose-5-phosphate 4-epimerase AraD [Planctomycetota bacterium]
MYEQTKQNVYLANKQLVDNNLVILTWGNVSEITPDRNAFVIKPSGVNYDQLTPDAMVVIDLSGNIIEGEYKPSSDTETHRILYQHFHDINGIAHTHSLYATSFAQARISLPCLGTTHADHFNGSVPITRPLTEQEIQIGYELNTGKVIVECFENLDALSMPAVLVAGHAPFTWGDSATTAVKNAVALEAVAQMAYQSQQLTNNQSPLLENYVLEKHYQRKHGVNAYYGQ